jgi:hypothetical protein
MTSFLADIAKDIHSTTFPAPRWLLCERCTLRLIALLKMRLRCGVPHG